MLKMPRRSQAQMLFEILEALHSSPMKLTRLMYKTNINCQVLSTLLRILENRGYVQAPLYRQRHPLSKAKLKPNSTKFKHPARFNLHYTLTEEGTKFFELIKSAMTEFQILLNVVDAQAYALELNSIR